MLLLLLVLLQTFFVSTLPPGELQGKQAVLETTHGTIVHAREVIMHE